MNFFVDIDDLNHIVVHESDCEKINDFRKNYIPDFYESYSEAWKYAEEKKLIYEFECEDCDHCKPGEWIQI